MEFDDLDHRINDTICAITGAGRTRDGQIQAVRRLAFDKEDTVLIAATGYGKSAVLYAFSALTSKITIQIVPLTKLGENQRDDIKKNVAESSPVWIDGDTHLKVCNRLPLTPESILTSMVTIESKGLGPSTQWRSFPCAS